MYKPLYDWLDKQEGRKDSSFDKVNKERERQGHKKVVAKKMKKKRPKCLNCNPSGTQVLGKRDCLTCGGKGYLD